MFGAQKALEHTEIISCTPSICLVKLEGLLLSLVPTSELID